MYFDLIGFDKKIVEDLFQNSNKPRFTITGTTTSAGGTSDRNFYADKQINMIRNLIEPTGDLYNYLDNKDYNFFLKLHPGGNDINDRIKAAFPEILAIPDQVDYWEDLKDMP